VVSVVLELIAPRLLGPAFMVAMAIIVKGYADVGDGFSAGVIVATAIALRYVVLGAERTEQGLPVLRHAPVFVAVGLLLSLGVASIGPLRGEPPFTHVPAAGASVVHLGTLELITAVVFDLGVFLLVTASLVVLVHHLARLTEGPQA
jgi:multisubunit Na+/H+ antiporter MnhB subunit